MNLLELQVRIVISGVPEGRGSTLLDWALPLNVLSVVPPAYPPPHPARPPESQS